MYPLVAPASECIPPTSCFFYLASEISVPQAVDEYCLPCLWFQETAASAGGMAWIASWRGASRENETEATGMVPKQWKMLLAHRYST